jgi:hypothetical protein
MHVTGVDLKREEGRGAQQGVRQRRILKVHSSSKRGCEERKGGN